MIPAWLCPTVDAVAGYVAFPSREPFVRNRAAMLETRFTRYQGEREKADRIREKKVSAGKLAGAKGRTLALADAVLRHETLFERVIRQKSESQKRIRGRVKKVVRSAKGNSKRFQNGS